MDKVFEAMIDPAVTKHFWFTRSSGRLEPGKTVTWYWDMYGVSGDVHVKELIHNKKISISWGDQTTVDFEFMVITDDTTYVTIRHYGFKQQGDELIAAIKDNTGGFTTVLDGMKAFLEHGIRLNLVAYKYPKEAGEHGLK